MKPSVKEEGRRRGLSRCFGLWACLLLMIVLIPAGLFSGLFPAELSVSRPASPALVACHYGPYPYCSGHWNADVRTLTAMVQYLLQSDSPLLNTTILTNQPPLQG
jgi:hypothetical protein